MKGKNKGFIFSIDSLSAVLIALTFLAVLSFQSGVQPSPNLFSEAGRDLLAALDKSGVLLNASKQSASVADATLYKYLTSLPSSVNANLTVYLYTAGGSGFSLSSTLIVQKGNVSNENSVLVKRVFLDVANTRFGLAQLVLSRG